MVVVLDLDQTVKNGVVQSNAVQSIDTVSNRGTDFEAFEPWFLNAENGVVQVVSKMHRYSIGWPEIIDHLYQYSKALHFTTLWFDHHLGCLSIYLFHVDLGLRMTYDGTWLGVRKQNLGIFVVTLCSRTSINTRGE